MGSYSLPSPIAKKLEGKVALITGGASGIGAATARLFIQHGAKVTIADIQDKLATSLIEEIGTEQTITFVHCNVTIESDVKNAVDTTIAKFGKLDIMFSNAGVYGKPVFSILDVDSDMIKNVFDVNVLGGFFCAKHAARVMIPEKKGVILFTASLTTMIYDNEVPHAYVASKNAVLGLSKNLGVELGKYGIRVNCVSPFLISTPLLLNPIGLDKQTVDDVLAQGANLRGVSLNEEDVANTVLYLTSDDSKYVSGLNLVIDGGYSTTNVALPHAYNKLLSSLTQQTSNLEV